ncbi:MAG: TonB-dependent receptor family protein [Gammaproteobacteria bacterium]
MFKSAGVPASLIAFLVSSYSIHAADALHVEPVVVSATRSLQSSVPTPAAISIIGRDEIEANGARHITEVLRGRGGVQLRDTYGDGNRAVVSMRGFGGNAAANTLILVDGRRLNNSDLGAPDLNSIALKDVERIEIIQGSAGVLFGDQAVGGVINVITRTPRGFDGSIAVGVGSFGARELRGAVGDRNANGLAYRLSAETRSSDNYRDNNRQEYSNLFGRIDYEHQHNGSVFLEYQAIDETLNLPGAIFADQVASDRTQTRFPNDFNDSRSHIARAGLRQTLYENWQVEAELTDRRSDGEGLLTGSSFTQDRHHLGFTPRLIGALPMATGDLLLTLGADLDRTDYDITSPFGTTDNRQHQRSAYAQGVIPLTSQLSATLGARHAKVENDLTDSFSFPAGTSIYDSEFVTSAGLSFAAAPEWRLFVRRDEVLRFPKIDEYTNMDATITLLETQTGESYELGSEWRRGGHDARVVLYRLDLDNEIDYDPSASFGFGGNTNLDPTRRDGLILDAHVQASDTLRLGGAYGYVDAEFDSGMFAGNRIPFVARHTFSLNADYRLSRAWHLFGEAQYIGERAPQGDYTNTLERLPGYAIYNASLDYRLNAWTVALRVDNIADKRYSDVAVRAFNPWPTEAVGYYPAPERSARVTAKYRFE